LRQFFVPWVLECVFSPGITEPWLYWFVALHPIFHLRNKYSSNCDRLRNWFQYQWSVLSFQSLFRCFYWHSRKDRDLKKFWLWVLDLRLLSKIHRAIFLSCLS